MRILRQGVVCKFFLFTEDCRKFNETLSIKAEMREFASILIGCHSHLGRLDRDIYKGYLFFREKKKKDESSYGKGFQ